MTITISAPDMGHIFDYCVDDTDEMTVDNHEPMEIPTEWLIPLAAPAPEEHVQLRKEAHSGRILYKEPVIYDMDEHLGCLERAREARDRVGGRAEPELRFRHLSETARSDRDEAGDGSPGVRRRCRSVRGRRASSRSVLTARPRSCRSSSGTRSNR